MSDFMAWLESSVLGHAMRESGVWTYGIVNLVHILGVGSLFGSIMVLDLRLLGMWRTVPLPSIVGPTVPVATFGFCTAVVSGICLLSTNATEYIGNPFLLVKFPAIFVGMVNVLVARSLPSWKAIGRRELSPHERRQLAVAGGISLASWLTAVSAGRMIGYW